MNKTFYSLSAAVLTLLLISCSSKANVQGHGRVASDLVNKFIKYINEDKYNNSKYKHILGNEKVFMDYRNKFSRDYKVIIENGMSNDIFVIVYFSTGSKYSFVVRSNRPLFIDPMKCAHHIENIYFVD